MSYVDGFIVPVPKARLDEYRKLAETASQIWREYGAIDYRECVADDVPYGTLTSFPRAVQLAEDEVVIFAWITYPSREVRDSCNQKVMADPRLAGMTPETMPFDGKRMIFGGFKTLVGTD